MGTNRRLLISIGSLLLFLTCIHAQGQGMFSEEDWDSFSQEYDQFNVEDFDSSDMEQTVSEDYEDLQQQSDEGPSRVNIITSPSPVYRTMNPYHNQKICSAFGNNNYKTFDGDIFHFNGHCSYQFVRHCKSNYEDFFVGITREVKNNIPVISGISMKIDGVDISLTVEIVTVSNKVVNELPFSIGTTQISKSGTSIRISSKIGMELMWNEEDSLTMELSEKYANQTCGLCGDYNGIPFYNEFIMNNAHLTPLQYGNLHKYHNPEEEKCEDPKEEADTECPINKHICKSVLTGAAFQDCNKIVEVQQYIELCEKDICRCTGNSTGFCLCNIFTEYSRQCAHAGGQPRNWRTSKICPLRCAFNLQFTECGTACPDTCTNSESSLVCDDHCTDGCRCPAGLVFDDIRKIGCIPKEECPCTLNGDVYPSGTGYSEKCQDCTCKGGKWSCDKKACFGVCALEGGSHITTFDLTRYNLHGDCKYTLAKTHDSNLFSLWADLSKCGHTDTETCLNSITLSLNGGNEEVLVKKCGSVYIDSTYTQLPVSRNNITIFKPTSFYIIVNTNKGIQLKIQTVPNMQVYISLDPKHMDKTSGLCGNFNDIQADDFKSPAGVIEGTGSSFGNMWKSHADCPNVKNNFEDPCALMGQNEQYASHHCDVLLASDGPFASCHKYVDPEAFHKNCMFDACNCDKKEDCMCTALSSYVSACSRQGVDIRGWRTNTCHSYTTTCQPGHTYSYSVSTCMPSCRSLSEPDVTCEIDFGSVDGCICEDGTYRTDNGDCVLPALCPCYYKGTAITAGDMFHENGAMCTCTNGKLECMGVNDVARKECEHPMVYFDCDNATAGAKGSECQKSCSTFENDCYSSSCVSGCVCPEGLALDDERNICIAEEDCPCRLNDDYYAAGETVQVKCNTCTCKSKKWDCTTETCLGTCAVYGDGHYLTYDNRRYRFNGNSFYTLVQDYCSSEPSEGTFRVLTENVPCSSQGPTCSKSIRLYLGNVELILDDQKFDVVKRNVGQYVPFKVRQMGLYLVVEAGNGVTLIWDKKTSISIKLDAKFEGKVCGLCGNYDGNAANDYITRSQSVVGDVAEFGNSWKLSSNYPDAVEIKDTCASNPYRKAWSQKQCSVITSGAFVSCHGLVDPVKYYDACVNDACSCDSGGDCDCFCTAVAAYAQACSEAGQCIHWRTPNICPVFCDFYNQQGHCEWHYQACGAPCMKTCMNPTGICYNKLNGLEGCYPTCPEDRPYFNEEAMQCVASCNCYDEYGEEYKPGAKMPGSTRCSVCTCTKDGKECTKAPACCEYQGKEFLPGDVVYNTADTIGGCLNAICSENSTIERMTGSCPTTVAPKTTFDFTSSSTYEGQSTPSTPHEGSTTSSTPTESSPGTTSGGKSTEGPVTSTARSETPPSSTGDSNTSTEVPTVSPTACVEAYDCSWSEWYDVGNPENNEGDFERFTDIESQGHKLCKNPSNVQCRAKDYPGVELKDLGQDVTCNRRTGLVCLNSNNPEMCYNFELRVECCKYRECTATSSSTSTEQTSSATISVSIKPTSPTTKEHPTSHPTDTATSSEIIPLETSTPRTSGETTPQQPETSKFPSPTSSSTPETSSPVTDKTSRSSEGTTKAPKPSPTTSCAYKMECRWTPWYDSNERNTKSDGGDTEKIDDIKAKGYKVCTDQEVAKKIECEAINEKGLAIANNNQNFSCDLKDGLKCNNRDQSKKAKCHNYQIRIECCQKVCEPPEVITTETTKPGTTSSEMTTQGTTSTESEPSQVSTRPPSSTPSTPLTTVKPSIEVTPSPEILCVYKMECRWTEWFDDKKPDLKSDGGETESITSEGREVCKTGEVEDKVECEAIDKKGVPIINNNQKFNCSLKDGVSCKNRDQINKGKCHNYRIRVSCCEEVCESVPTPSISTTETTELTTISGESTTHGISITTLPEPGPTGISSTEKPDISSPSEGTSHPSTSSSSKVTTSSTSTTATCIYKMECRWTPWYDMNRPTLQNDGGDSESSENIKSKGHQVCTEQEVENNIQCDAIDLDGVTIANNQQILTCALKSGLNCKNSDQKDAEMCHNYRMRVECCALYCEPVVTTTSNNVATKSSSPTTSSVTVPTLTSPKDCNNERALECRWTQWYNENKPSKEFNGEENENSDKIKSVGLEICKKGEVKTQIECKNELQSETTSEQYRAQKTTCNVKDGLICKNQDQSGEICEDFSIRYECCSEKFVKTCGESITPSSTEATSVATTISVTQPSSSETLPHSTSVTGNKVPSTSAEITSGSNIELPSSPSSTSSEVTSATSSPTTGCIKKMECRWTLWHDNNSPNTKGAGGDTENAEDIEAKGHQICDQHEVKHNIECEAVNKEGEVVSDNQQKMICDLKNGLSCLNKDQKKKEKCHNYRIRFECCAEVCDKDTPKTTLATTSSISKTELTSKESTPPVSTESPSPSDTKSPTSSTGVSSTPTTSSTTKTQTTSPTPATTTSCEKFRQSECRWTDWHNTGKPSPDISGGDFENSKKLSSLGIEVCKNEEVENEIECKDAQHPYSSYEKIQQKATCNLKEGLVCKNNEQSGEIKQCKDYEIRIECCSKKFIESCGKPTPYPTSPSSSEVTKSPLTTSVTEAASHSSRESTPGQPTSSQRTTTGEQPITSTTTGQTSPSEGQTSGKQPTTGTMSGQTSSFERSTSGEQPTTGSTPGETSSTQRPTSGEQPTTGEQPNKGTTTVQTSSSERTTSGEQPNIVTISSQTSSSEKPTAEEQQTIETTTSQPSFSERPISSEHPTTGEQPTTGTTPGQTSSSERPTSSEQPTTGEQLTTGTTPGETSSSERQTTGEQPTKGTTPGQTSSSEKPTSGEQSTTGEQPHKSTTPGQTSSSQGITSGEQSTTGEQPNIGTTPGQTSSPEKPTSGEQSTTGEQPNKGTTPGQTSSSERSTSGEQSTTGEQPNIGTTLGQTSSSERSTSGEQSTTGEQPNIGTTPGQTSSSERPTSGEQSTTGEQPNVGTTPGQTSSSERPTSGEQSTTGEQPNKGSTPGQTSSSERSTSGEQSTTGEQPNIGTTPGQTSSSERPTSGEQSTTGEQPNVGTTPGHTSSSERPTSGEQSTGEQPSKGTTPGQTSMPQGLTSGEQSTTGEQPNIGTTPGQTSSSERPTSGEQSTTGEQPNKGTTPGQTSSSERSTSGEQSTTGEQPNIGTTPGQTSSSERPTSGEQSTGEQPSKGTTPGQTSSSQGLTSGEQSTTGEQPNIGTTPGQTSSSERPTSGEQSTTGEQPNKGTTPGQTSSSQGLTSGEQSTTGEQPNIGTTPGQTSSSERPTSGEQSTAEQPSKGTTPGQTSSSERPTSGEQSTTGEQPNKGTTPGQTSSSERPTSGEQSTTGEQPSKGTTAGQTSSQGLTSGEQSTTGEQPNIGTTPGQTSSSERPTSGEQSTTGEQPNKGTTPGQTSSSERPTSGEQSTTSEQPNIGTTPGQTSSSERPTSGEQSTTGEQPSKGTTPGQTSSSQGITSGEQSTTGEQPNIGTTPGQTSSSERPTSGEQSTTGEQPNKGTTPGQTSSSERPTSGEQSTTGEQPSKGTTAGQTSSQGLTSGEQSTTAEQPNIGTTPGQTSSSERSTSGEQSTTGEQPNKGTTPGQTSSSERPTSGEQSTTGEQPNKGTTPGQTSSSQGLTSGEQSTTGEQPNIGTTPGQTSSSERPTSGEQSTTGEQPNKGTTPGQTSSSERPTSGEQPTTGEPLSTGTTPGQTSSSERQTTVPSEHTSETSTSYPHSTTRCFCKMNDTMYKPAEKIYTVHDNEGCAFHAVCGNTCQVEWSLGECSTTEPSHTSEEQTSIKDVSSTKPSMTRPSRRPPTGSSGTPYEPETSTDSTCGPCECLMPNCSTGYRVVSHMAPGACCASISCEPDDVCVADNTIYKPGSTIPQAKDACQKCECSKGEKDKSGFYAVTCEELVCDKTCKKGFEYADKQGECCGECVPKQCTMTKKNIETGEKAETGQKGESGVEDSEVLIQIGDTYRPEGSTCSYYECDEEDGKPVLTKVKKVCQELDISKCAEGTVKYDEDGCCQTCTYKSEVQIVEKPVVENCSSRKNVTIMKEGDCEVEVELTYCGGPCMGTSMYSAKSQGMDHKCSCCTELEVAERQVELLCANGQRLTHYYKDVVKCGCSVATCEPVTSDETQDTQQVNQKYQSISRRRRR
ncbi:uncharacterized protein [Dendrobates tinctorius]|uniref:uncharacterized protein n=1 Tax=Dendrobates tinctorius TaxID=92724 RepID=UPI003CC97AC9